MVAVTVLFRLTLTAAARVLGLANNYKLALRILKRCYKVYS